MSTQTAPVLRRFASQFRYDQAPMLVYWESTRACDLACAHCRAEAMPTPHPLELSTGEARALFREIRGFDDDRAPHLVITGGDPLQRNDLFELVAYARELDIDVSVTPAATPRLTVGVIERLRASGVGSLAFSLDGSDAPRHDSLRGVPGTFDRTVAAIKAAKDIGMPLQINTMVTDATLDDLPRIYEVLSDLTIERWALFSLSRPGAAGPCQRSARGKASGFSTGSATSSKHRMYSLQLGRPRPLIFAVSHINASMPTEATRKSSSARPSAEGWVFATVTVLSLYRISGRFIQAGSCRSKPATFARGA